MPKTSVETFLTLIRHLNNEMDQIATKGQQIIIKMNEIDFTSVTHMQEHDEFEHLFETTGEKFRELNDMKQVLMDGLKRKVIQNMNANTPSSRAKSVSVRQNSKSKSPSARKTRRIKSI